MQELFNLFGNEQEDVDKVIRELSHTCSSCRLSLIHPLNKGLVHRGNPHAKIAVIAEAPGDTETQRAVPLVGRSGQEFQRWMKYIDLDTRKDLWISNIINCQPEKSIKEGRSSQDSPKPDEITACFGPRTMRVLQAMPNLEVVITMGWVAAKALLGGDPGIKTHEGQWFESSLLPGIAVFCLEHPAYVLRQKDNNPEAAKPTERCLDYFKYEYLDENKTILDFAKKAKDSRENNNQSLF
jgi:uracil-DNA glycosylase family 4